MRAHEKAAEMDGRGEEDEKKEKSGLLEGWPCRDEIRHNAAAASASERSPLAPAASAASWVREPDFAFRGGANPGRVVGGPAGPDIVGPSVVRRAPRSGRFDRPDWGRNPSADGQRADCVDDDNRDLVRRGSDNRHGPDR